MPEHTPGPWNKDWIAGALRHICRNVDSDMFLVEPLPDDANTPSYYQSGDVELIWGAPELLAVCKSMREWFGKLDDWKGPCGDPPVDELRAAIARAEPKEK